MPAKPAGERQPASPSVDRDIFSLDKVPNLFQNSRMYPATPLPVATKLLGLFVRGFWRRLA
jgi:hypothetical protein